MIRSDLIFATEVDVQIQAKVLETLPEEENTNQFLELVKEFSKTQMTSEERIEHNVARRKEAMSQGGWYKISGVKTPRLKLLFN